jgi:hypothetical protein
VAQPVSTLASTAARMIEIRRKRMTPLLGFAVQADVPGLRHGRDSPAKSAY